MLHIDVNVSSQKNGPNNYFFPHNTPLAKLNIMHEDYVGYLRMLCTPDPLILQFHMPTKKKPSFASKEDMGSIAPVNTPRRTKFNFASFSAPGYL